MHILLLGGGTLGPVTPLLAVVEELRAKDATATFVFVGTQAGPERDVVTKAGISFVGMSAAKVDRFFHPRLFLVPFRFLASLFVAARILRRECPDVLVSAGGYVTIPFGFLARAFRIPLVLLQLDVLPVRTNRVLEKRAQVLLFALAASQRFFSRTNGIVVGVPVRHAIRRALEERADLITRALKRWHLKEGMPVLLVLGGGTGSLQINRLVNETLSSLLPHAQVIHVTGKDRGAAPRDDVGYHAFSLLDEEALAEAYAVADLVVSRAGMGTIGELAVVARPFVLIPLPDSPQEANAKLLVDQAVIPVLSGEVAPDAFLATILGILRDPRSYPGSLARLRALFPVRAAAHMAEIVTRVARGEEADPTAESTSKV